MHTEHQDFTTEFPELQEAIASLKERAPRKSLDYVAPPLHVPLLTKFSILANQAIPRYSSLPIFSRMLPTERCCR